MLSDSYLEYLSSCNIERRDELKHTSIFQSVNKNTMISIQILILIKDYKLKNLQIIFTTFPTLVRFTNWILLI